MTLPATHDLSTACLALTRPERYALAERALLLSLTWAGEGSPRIANVYERFAELLADADIAAESRAVELLAELDGDAVARDELGITSDGARALTTADRARLDIPDRPGGPQRVDVPGDGQ